MAPKGHPDNGELTDDSYADMRAEAEAERVRAMLRDGGVEDPVVMVGGTGEDRGNPRVHVWLEDMNATAVKLISDPSYTACNTTGTKVYLKTTFRGADD